MNLLRIPAVQFTHDLWRAGSLTEIGIKQRTWNIAIKQNKIKNIAVGFTEGEKLYVRPKNECVAVMFFYNNEHFWTHLTNEEFLICFPELKNFLQNIKI